jgi:signal transduction histidine kinase
MLFYMFSVLWPMASRSDTMKNYRAYRSKLAMSKHSRLKHYGLAVIACAVAVALAGPVDAPSSCFLLAIMVSSLFGDTGSGLLAVGLSAIAFNFFFLPSPLTLSSPSAHYLRFGVFVVAALATNQLVETRRRIEESRRRIEEALSSTQARLSRATQIATVAELAASIAHEVSQPLSAVVANGRACIQWLSADPADLANAKVAAERIIRDGKAAGEVVQHMRALFKKTALERAALDVNEVIEEVLSLIHDETVRKQIVVETDLEKRLPQTLGDRVQLQQVIFNLLLNGIEAMEAVADRPKKLIIRSKMQGSDAILVEVRDYGNGVADSDKVFEAFYTTKEKGMGMGLSICRSIVEAHGGQLGISTSQGPESQGQESQGPGTTFFFTLPLGTSEPT